jgi:hypothetical protein
MWNRLGRCRARFFNFAAATLAAASVLAGPAQAQPGPDDHSIRLKTATFDPLSNVPSHVSLPNIDGHGAGRRGGFLVQFNGPITDAARAALEAAGASIKGYVPLMTLEVVMTDGERAGVGRIPGVRWVGPYQPSFKVSSDLLERADADPSAALKLQVSLFPREGNAGAGALAGLGAQVRNIDRGESFEVAHVEIAAAQLRALARQPLVRFIEPEYELQPHNDLGRSQTGLSAIANDTFSAGIDASLDGFDESSGFRVKYGHFDGGLYPTHADFSSASVTLEPGSTTSAAASAHGTHTAASVAGDGGEWASVPVTPPGSGSVSIDKWRGMTPQAALHHISFGSGYGDRQIFEREVEEGAHISTNSWGWSSGGASITNYVTNTQLWDEGVWDADNDVAGRQPLIVFFSAGNNGNGTTSGCGSPAGDNVGAPGNAKNVITVGANEAPRGCDSRASDVDEMAYFSSRGPVDPDGTGRGLFKPDITNIGTLVMSAEAPGTGGGGWDSLCSNTGTSYAYNSGTSMSTPLTAGLGGVVLQDLVTRLGVAQPKPSLVKALLINGAVSLHPGGCSYSFAVNQTSISQGWGMVNALNSMYGPGGTQLSRNVAFENEENDVSTGGQYARQVDVAAGTPLKVTLVWTDYPASPGTLSPLVVNDLDLEVSGPGGAYLGNNFAGDWSIAGGTADRYNVVENVYIQAPAAGTYTITVKGFQVVQDRAPGTAGTNQLFSLAWSGDLNAGPPNTSPEVNIGAPSDGSSFNLGDPINFAGSATDSEDGDIGANLAWTSSLDGPIGNGAAFSTSSLGAGAHTITASVTDSGGLPGSDAITVTVNGPPNTPPVANPQSVSSDEDNGLAITLTGSDGDSDPLTFAIVSGPSSGSLSGTAPNVTYTPNANFNGADSFTFKANDGSEDSAPAAVDIAIDAVNDAPSFSKGPDQTVAENAGAQTVVGWATAISPGPSNESGQTVAFLIASNSNPGIFAAAPAVAANGTLTSTPLAAGTSTIGVQAMDNGGTANGGVNLSAIQSFVVTITAPPPPLVDNLAAADFANARGTVSGSYLNTHVQDDSHEALTEQQQGNPARGRSLLDHTWTFNVAAGSEYMFRVDAYHSPNSEGDDFAFSYSRDNSTYTTMLTVTKTADDDSEQTYLFPQDVAGTLYVRVLDTNGTQGSTQLDTLFVDFMAVTTSTGGTDTFPPTAPTGLAATAGDGSVGLDWANNSESDLAGYNVYRAATSGGPYNKLNGALLAASAYTDNAVSNGTTYYYVVTAVDTSDNQSGNSAEASATPNTPGLATSLHVQSVVTSTVNAGGGNKRGQAVVVVVDNLGDPVSGAFVTGQFGGSYNEPGSGTTGANGSVTMQTSQTLKGGVTVAFCIGGVTGGLPYVPGDNGPGVSSCGP